ncbi:hypothetical protein VaNZ11_007992 [Volvox africanus]|uniref:Guanylate cyclase domain-containing protein n=1 Tax=Volvox africanus TaxID=51714 RepID=A0ABQ5S4E9_9CHLO|nr:hypothetical protein VaNZ11_007992 [Volvox africanus]
MTYWYMKLRVVFLSVICLWALAGISESEDTGLLQNDYCVSAVLDSLIGLSSSPALDGVMCMNASSSAAAVARAFRDPRCLMDVTSNLKSSVMAAPLPSTAVSEPPLSALNNSSSSITLAWMQCPSWANGLIAEWLDAAYADVLKSLGRYEFEIIIQPPPPSNVSDAEAVHRVNLEVAGGAGGGSGINLAFSADASTEELEFLAATTEDFEHLPENSCSYDPHPLGPLHPRTFLLMWYRADTLSALGFNSPPDHWEELLDLLATHKKARTEEGASLPQYGLCITDNPHCGRAGDVLAAVAASVVQSRGTSQGYVFDLNVPPPAAEPLVNGSGWRYAAALVEQLLSYNAPDNDTKSFPKTPSPRRTKSLVCHAVSPYFTAGSCMVTLEWDAALPHMAAAAPLQRPDALGVAPLPGSRWVASTPASTDDLVLCNAQTCGVSVIHDFLYGMYGVYDESEAISSVINELVPAPWPPGHNISRDTPRALALVEAASIGRLGVPELAGAPAIAAASTATNSKFLGISITSVNRAPFSSFFRENTEVNYGGIVDAGGDITDLEVAFDSPRMNILERRLIRQAATDRLRGGMGWERRRTPSNASVCEQYVRTPWWRMVLQLQRAQNVSSRSSFNESMSANSTTTTTTMAAAAAALRDAAVTAATDMLRSNNIPEKLILPYLRALWHALHSPNSAPVVVAPAEPNWFRWALGHAASELAAAAAAAGYDADTVHSNGSGGFGDSNSNRMEQSSRTSSNISDGDDSVTAAVTDGTISTAVGLIDKYFRLVTSVLDSSVVRLRYETSISAPDWLDVGLEKDEGRSTALRGGALVGLVVGCQVALALLLSAVALLFWCRRGRRHRDLLGRVRAPQAGPDTTLLITDVQNSTVLWEALSVATMDAALQLHHACIRQLLEEYDGYESATEGDSFIVAFASPASATAFAASCQLALLEADWPQELLQHPDGAMVVVEPRVAGQWSTTGASHNGAAAAAIAAAGAISDISLNGRTSLHAAAASGMTGGAALRLFQCELGSTGGKLLRGISSAIARSVSVTSIGDVIATAPTSSLHAPSGRRAAMFGGASTASTAVASTAPRLPVNAPLTLSSDLPPSLPTAATQIAAVALPAAAEDAESYSRKPTIGNRIGSASPRMSLEGGSPFGAIGIAAAAAAAAAGAADPLPLPSSPAGRAVSGSLVRSEVALTLSQAHQGQDRRQRYSLHKHLRPIPPTSPSHHHQQQQSQQQQSQQPGPAMIRDSYSSCPEGTQRAIGSAPLECIINSGAGGYESGGGGRGSGVGMADNSGGLATTSIFSGLFSTVAATSKATGPATRSMSYRDALAAALSVSWLPVLPSRGGAIEPSSRSRPYVRLCDGRIVAFRGLRVRMGLHSGLSTHHHVFFNKVAASYQYSGEFAEVTRLVSDSAPGGLVVMSGPAFARLRHCVERGGWAGGGGGGGGGRAKEGGSRCSIAMKEIKVIYAGHHLLKIPADGAASAINSDSTVQAAVTAAAAAAITELAAASGSGFRSAGLSQQSEGESSSPEVNAVLPLSKAVPWLIVASGAGGGGGGGGGSISVGGGGGGGGGAPDSSVLLDTRIVDVENVTELNFESGTFFEGGGNWAVGASDSRQADPLAAGAASGGNVGGGDGAGGGEADLQRRRRQRRHGTVPEAPGPAAGKGMGDVAPDVATTAKPDPQLQPVRPQVEDIEYGEERLGDVGGGRRGGQRDLLNVFGVAPGCSGGGSSGGGNGSSGSNSGSGGTSSGNEGPIHGLWPASLEIVHQPPPPPLIPHQQHSRTYTQSTSSVRRCSFDAVAAATAASGQPVSPQPLTPRPSMQASRTQALTLWPYHSAQSSIPPVGHGGGGAATAAAATAVTPAASRCNQYDAQGLLDSLPNSLLQNDNNRHLHVRQVRQNDPDLSYFITLPPPPPPPLLPPPPPPPLLQPPTPAGRLLQSLAKRQHSTTRTADQQPCQAPQHSLLPPPPLPTLTPLTQPQSPEHLLKVPQPLYVAVPSGLLCRLALVSPLRSRWVSQLSSLDAPTGLITVAFLKVVGAATLLAELPGGVAVEALGQCQRLVVGRLGAAGGYLVEGCGDGLVLAAFGSPTAAVEWALDCLEGLRRLDWDPRLLAHELCEEVISFAPQGGLMIAGTAPGTATGQQAAAVAAPAVAVPAVAAGADKGPGSAIAGVAGRFRSGCGRGAGGGSTGVATPQSLNQQISKEHQSTGGPPVLSRGLRIKVGIDVGSTTCDLNPGSGRLTYRGRVMNRASRIAGIAAAGQVLVSGAVWEEVAAAVAASASASVTDGGGSPPPPPIAALSLGNVSLKGVKEPLEVLQCSLHK